MAHTNTTPDAGDPIKRSRWGQVAAFALVFGLLALFAWSLVNNQSGPRSQGPAPDFSMKAYDGQEITLSSFRGQVVVINFWASWCPPCREEAEYLESTWRRYREQGVIFIGVDYLDTEQDALSYIEEFDITYPNGPDLGTHISQAYRIRGVPETFFVAKDGTLRGVKIGPLFSPELEQRLDDLLAEEYGA